eukprot:scaffold397469_cov26-Prasinocladus_malaysianus.AAC.3
MSELGNARLLVCLWCKGVDDASDPPDLLGIIGSVRTTACHNVYSLGKHTPIAVQQKLSVL